MSDGKRERVCAGKKVCPKKARECEEYHFFLLPSLLRIRFPVVVRGSEIIPLSPSSCGSLPLYFPPFLCDLQKTYIPPAAMGDILALFYFKDIPEDLTTEAILIEFYRTREVCRGLCNNTSIHLDILCRFQFLNLH